MIRFCDVEIVLLELPKVIDKMAQDITAILRVMHKNLLAEFSQVLNKSSRLPVQLGSDTTIKDQEELESSRISFLTIDSTMPEYYLQTILLRVTPPP